ncbi:hypothetical protein KPB02_13925 [Burkholderia cenocepacia]|uniref:hypothetical protein n=1 Tax=Burkholderia cenocepacia TaxID=95486 RepID=UPI00285C401F|nr:hypothetical protein [Burkholderia cenocepacia]MDR8027838.1 hypothetical protein [Burkholderia cenocepacia]
MRIPTFEEFFYYASSVCNEREFCPGMSVNTETEEVELCNGVRYKFNGMYIVINYLTEFMRISIETEDKEVHIQQGYDMPMMPQDIAPDAPLLPSLYLAVELFILKGKLDTDLNTNTAKKPRTKI